MMGPNDLSFSTLDHRGHRRAGHGLWAPGHLEDARGPCGYVCATCMLWATVRALARTLHETPRRPIAPSGAMDLIWGSTSSTSSRPIGTLRDPLLQARHGMPSSSEVTVYGSVGSWTSGDILGLLSLCVLHACYGLQ